MPTKNHLPRDAPSPSKPINFLISVMFVTGDHYVTEQIETGYKITMRITIKNVNSTDFGSYRCVAKNSLGETDGTIKLYGMDFLSPMRIFSSLLHKFQKLQCQSEKCFNFINRISLH